MNLAASLPPETRRPTTVVAATGACPMRTLVVDSYAAATAFATGLVGDGTHFTCAVLPGGGWAFCVADDAPQALDALLVLASRAAAGPRATTPVALVSR